ncbi:UNVERIFIED_CONTAM: hypothetical protein O8I53_11880 [Campylobacter lari]
MINKINKENIVKKDESDLFKDIYEVLSGICANRRFMHLKVNEPIGTLNADFVIYANKKPELVILLDEYAYANNLEKYLELNDLFKFIKSKKYKTYLLDRIK